MDNDLNAVQRKRAERVVDVLLEKLNSHIASGVSIAEVREELASITQRILNPEFNEIKEDFESSNIGGLAYDPVSRVLQVDFSSGSRYHYFDFENLKYEEFLESESKGRFFSSEVRGKYTYARI